MPRLTRQEELPEPVSLDPIFYARPQLKYSPVVVSGVVWVAEVLARLHQPGPLEPACLQEA